MSEEDDNRRKRVAFRCHHTGMRENDLLFGAFVDRHLHELSDADVDWLERLVMEHDDLDLNNWMTGRAPVPVELDHPVMRALKSFKFTV
ncbi:MAG: succinate dehydrogenase assembly factor 2 [Rhodospirillales bacterium]|nr:succinate dehydrogenase assembly factor 2 [Rhodospirillales bacterium]